MKHWLALLALTISLLLLTGCVVQSQPKGAAINTITMGPNNFIQKSITW